MSYVFSSKWRTFGSEPGQLRYPFGIALDSSGNVFVSESGNGRIQKFTNTGIFTTKWGSRGSADGQFLVPHGIAIKSATVSFPEERVFVSDTGNSRIQVFKPKIVVHP